MAVVSTTKVLEASIDWDKAWAERAGSGSGVKWRISPNSGVTIDDPTKRRIMVTFQNPGEYTAYLGVTDGAMPAYAAKKFTVEEGSINIPITDDEDVVVPVQVTLPVGQAVYNKLDCAIAIDTSGSMSAEINTAKSKAGEIIDALRTGSGDVQCAARGYNEPGDYSYNTGNTYLSGDINTIKSQINAISLHGGADESHFYAIDTMSKVIQWRKSSLRVFIQFTDEPPNQDKTTNPSVALATMQANNIHYIHIWCDNSETNQTFKDLANNTAGKYYKLGDGAAAIVSSIKDALDAMSRNLTVELVTGEGTGQALVKEIKPAKHTGIDPGDTFSFTVTFNRKGLPAGHGTQKYKFDLNVRTATDLALLETIPVYITVSW